MSDQQHEPPTLLLNSAFFRASEINVISPLALAFLQNINVEDLDNKDLSYLLPTADGDEPVPFLDFQPSSMKSKLDGSPVRELDTQQGPFNRNRFNSVVDFSGYVARGSSQLFDTASASDVEADAILHKLRHRYRLKTVVQTIISARLWSQLRSDRMQFDDMPPLSALQATAVEQLPIEFDSIHGKTVVSTGTIDNLIDLLVSPGEVDLDYIHDFLSTYRYFMDAHTLLSLLIQRFLEVIEGDEGPMLLSSSSSATSSNASSNTSSALSLSDGKSSTLKVSQLSLKGNERSTSPLPNMELYRRSRVLNVLRMWVTRHPDDFLRDQQLEQQVSSFINEHVAVVSSLARYGQSVIELMATNHLPNEKEIARHPLVTAFVGQYSATTSTERKGKASILLDNRSQLGGGVHDFKAEKLAQQLTVIEMEFFRKIFQDELVMQKWTKHHDSNTNLLRHIEWFNHVSYWVATEICLEPKLTQRVALIKMFLEVARYCLAFHNFSGVFEIVSGLILSPVSRLKKTWKSIPSKSKQLWADLVKFTMPEQNFVAYRDTLKNSGFPLVPYIGVLLKDLTFAEDGQPSKIKERINFFKFHTIGRILNEIRQYQQAEYPFKEDPKILAWLSRSMVNMSIEDMTLISKRFEPPDEV